MNDLRHILVIDNDYNEFSGELDSSFSPEGIGITYCATKDEAILHINSGRTFDLILLDWFLETEDSEGLLAQLILKHLKERLFVPVFVWSNHIDKLYDTISADAQLYPVKLITGISKAEFRPSLLKDRIKQLYNDSTAAKISKIYRSKICVNLEKVFFELADLPVVDIAVVLKNIVGEADDIDWSNDFVLNLVHRRLINDTQFTENLKSLLAAANINKSTEDESLKKSIISKIMYFKSEPCFIHCCDIVELQINEIVNKIAIVVTPDCDIAHCNSRFLELIEMRLLDDPDVAMNIENKENVKKYNHSSYYFLPALPLNGQKPDYMAIFKSKLVIEENITGTAAKYPKASKRLAFSDKFIFQGKETTAKLVCGLSNPYRSDFLHFLHAHNSRVGTPDIKNLWL